MFCLFVREAQAMCGSLGEMAGEVEERGEEETSEERARDEGELERQEGSRKAVGFDVGRANQGNLASANSHPGLPSFESD